MHIFAKYLLQYFSHLKSINQLIILIFFNFKKMTDQDIQNLTGEDLKLITKIAYRISKKGTN